jgi:hypothetical protein
MRLGDVVGRSGAPHFFVGAQPAVSAFDSTSGQETRNGEGEHYVMQLAFGVR